MPESVVVMKINCSAFMLMLMVVISVEAVDNNSKGIHKKRRPAIRFSPEFHDEAIKILRQMYVRLQVLDQKLEEVEQQLCRTDSILTQINQSKKS